MSLIFKIIIKLNLVIFFLNMKTAKAHLESIFEKNIESEFTFDKGPIYNELTTASHTGDNFYSMHKKKPNR